MWDVLDEVSGGGTLAARRSRKYSPLVCVVKVIVDKSGLGSLFHQHRPVHPRDKLMPST